MPRHPSVYATMLGELMHRHRVRCWLLNTGCSGGAYGTGQRMPIRATRALLRAALSGRLEQAPMSVDPVFGLRVPQVCPEVDPGLLNPRATWQDKAAYDRAARDLAQRFERNFARFAPFVGDEVQAAGIRAAA